MFSQHTKIPRLKSANLCILQESVSDPTEKALAQLLHDCTLTVVITGLLDSNARL